MGDNLVPNGKAWPIRSSDRQPGFVPGALVVPSQGHDLGKGNRFSERSWGDDGQGKAVLLWPW